METKTTTKNKLIKKFHALLSEMGLGADAKMAILDGFGVASTKELSERELEDICNVLVAKKKKDSNAGADKWRKRVLASAFGVAKHMEYDLTMADAKGMVVRATGGDYEEFNSISTRRLQNIYYGFLRVQKDLQHANETSIEMLANFKPKHLK